MTPGIIVFTTGLAFISGLSIGFVSGYFFRKGDE